MMTETEYQTFVGKRRAAYPIVWAKDMTTVGAAPPGPSNSSSSMDDSSANSPLLPVAASQDTHAEDSAMSTAADEPMPDAATSATTQGPSGLPVGDTSVPALMVAECHGPALRRNMQLALSGREVQVCCATHVVSTFRRR